MKTATIKITNPKFQHAQFCQKLTQVAGEFTCDISIVVGTNIGNAKSLINVMSVLGELKLPGKIEIRANGWDDDAKAIETITALFN